MKNDMTYSELGRVKENIKEFNQRLEEIASSLGGKIEQEEREFYSFIGKHIILFKYLYNGSKEQYFFKVIISDLYYFIISLIRGETRYVYVNERSIIENYTRAITRKTVEEDHVTAGLFSIMKEIPFSFNFTNDNYALIKDEYITSCGYIHGGDILGESLVNVLDECLEVDIKIKDITKYHIRIRKIFTLYDKMLISIYGEYISGAFHRQKTVFQYLLGEDALELLFCVTQ